MGDWRKKAEKLAKKAYGRAFSKTKDAPSEGHILFVSGYEAVKEQPEWRRRVTNQREQLESCGFATNTVNGSIASFSDEYDSDAFVLCKCEMNEGVTSLIERAKANGKPLIFDAGESLAVFGEDSDGVKEAAASCDMIVASTKALADLCSKEFAEVFLNRSVASRRTVELSNEALKKISIGNSGVVTLGFFCDQDVFGTDLELIVDPLLEVLSKHENVFIKLFDDCAIPEGLLARPERLIKVGRPTLEKMPELLRGVDVNLVPLRDTPANSVQTEYRWIEASLVAVPTVASNVGGYSEMIENGKTGFLCASPDEWSRCISELVSRESFRKGIGRASRSFCLANCTTSKAPEDYCSILKPFPRSSESVAAACSTQSGDVVAEFLKSRGIDLAASSIAPQSEVIGDTQSRVEYLLEAKREGRMIAAAICNRARIGALMNRLCGIEAPETLKAQGSWDVTCFYEDELDALSKRLCDIDLVIFVESLYSPALGEFAKDCKDKEVAVAYASSDCALDEKAAYDLIRARAINVRDRDENEYWYGAVARMRQMALLSDCVVVPDYGSTGPKQDVLGKELVPLPAKLSDQRFSVARELLRERGESGSESYVIGYFCDSVAQGRDFSVAEKQVNDFLEAHDDAKLVVVGPMNVSFQLYKLAKRGRVLFLPGVRSELKPLMYGAMDVVLLPFRDIKYNSVQSEANAIDVVSMGVPVLVSEFRGSSRIIEEIPVAKACKEGDWLDSLEHCYQERGSKPGSTSANASSSDESAANALEASLEKMTACGRGHLKAELPEGLSALVESIDDWSKQADVNLAFGRHEVDRKKGAKKQSASELSVLAKDAVFKVQREGFEAGYELAKKKQRDWRRKAKNKKENPQGKVFFDVLFINGCDRSVPHPIRYRVDHQIQQLRAAGLTASKKDAKDLKLVDVCKARAFVIFRCPYTSRVGTFIELAKKLNKKVYYDIDDLVIDRKYTDTIKYLETMIPCERDLYDEGVERMGRTLRECGSAITTTERLAQELGTIVPEVFVNRNTASERMLALSNRAARERFDLPVMSEDEVSSKEAAHHRWAIQQSELRNNSDVIIGYFSGSITHNDDIDYILPVLVDVMKARPNVKLMFAGILDVPQELEPFRDRLIAHEFCRWIRLPDMIVKADINIVPLVDTVFNEAKSENKWVEAALVRVPTIASNVGAFAKMMVDDDTGILCDSLDDWRDALLRLIDDEAARMRIGNAAHDYCIKNCLTTSTGHKLAHYLQSQFTRNVFMVLPSLATSGGVLVALDHCAMLQRAGYDVTIVDDSPCAAGRLITHDGCVLPVIHGRSHLNKKNEYLIDGSVDVMVATLWSTTRYFDNLPRIGSKRYLVQNFETDFYEPPDPQRVQANATYNRDDFEYITISRWCQDWLKELSRQEARYAPNGFDPKLFPHKERDFATNRRVRILVEGNSKEYYKNVDESFRVIQHLDPNRYEVWFMSYKGKPKPFYRVDRFLHNIPHEDVGKVYAQCDILLKTSLLESFSYPPLEMMATGGFVVAIPNDGNKEFLEHGANCLLFEHGDIAGAVASIETIVESEEIRERLKAGMKETVASREWSAIVPQVLALYE